MNGSELTHTIQRCSRVLDKLDRDKAEHRRAGEILAATVEQCQAIAAAIKSDPTLADEPYETRRDLAVDLYGDIARQLVNAVTMMCDPRADLRVRHSRREDAAALAARAAPLADRIVEAIPRRDHATEAGSLAISRDRLAARYRDLTEAADSIRYAIAPALLLATPDPQAIQLAGIAEQLDQAAAELATHHEARHEAVRDACGLVNGPVTWSNPDPAEDQSPAAGDDGTVNGLRSIDHGGLDA